MAGYIDLRIPLFAALLASCFSGNRYPPGGYPYPTQLLPGDTNLYSYPILKIESRKDSFWDTYRYCIYRPFQEANLSIRPLRLETFRLTYQEAFGQCTIISLTENGITVKMGIPSRGYHEDESRLTDLERRHLQWFTVRFPLDTARMNTRTKRYVDSMIRRYPQLLDVCYYKSLIDKATIHTPEDFKDSVVRVPISKKTYQAWVDSLNSSGFWSDPYRLDCVDIPFDADGYSLEANTHEKYQIVSAGGCPDDTTRLTKVCQQLVQLAHQDKRIHLIWNGIVDTSHVKIDLKLPAVKDARSEN